MKLGHTLPLILIFTALLAATTAPPALAVDRDLGRMQNKLIRMTDKLSESVVGVEPYTPQMRRAMGMGVRPMKANATPAEKDAYEARLEETFYKMYAGGSGFIYGTAGHVITTTRAVPSMIKKAKVIFHDGAMEVAEVIGRSAAYNVVVLKITRKDLRPVRLGGEVILGQTVISTGNVFNVSYRMRRFAFSLGRVTALYNVTKARGFTTYYDGPVIETDAAVNPGIYGGPLFDLKGRLAGMLTSTFAYQRFMGSAIPLDRVKAGIEAALNPQKAAAGSVRFKVRSIGATLIYEGGRLVLAQTQKRGLMAKAGLRKGDVVLTLQGVTPNPDNFAALLAEAVRTGRLRLTMERDGWRKDFVLKPKGEKPTEDEEDF